MTDGEVVFEDDPSIETEDPVWRRIPPGWWTFDHNEGRVRPTSKCFQYSKNKETGKKHPMSVTLGQGLTPEAALAGQPEGFKLVGWIAGHLRNLELGVCRDDKPDIIAHGLVFTLQLDAGGLGVLVDGPYDAHFSRGDRWSWNCRNASAEDVVFPRPAARIRHGRSRTYMCSACRSASFEAVASSPPAPHRPTTTRSASSRPAPANKVGRRKSIAGGRPLRAKQREIEREVVHEAPVKLLVLAERRPGGRKSPRPGRPALPGETSAAPKGNPLVGRCTSNSCDDVDTEFPNRISASLGLGSSLQSLIEQIRQLRQRVNDGNTVDPSDGWRL